MNWSSAVPGPPGEAEQSSPLQPVSPMSELKKNKHSSILYIALALSDLCDLLIMQKQRTNPAIYIHPS